MRTKTEILKAIEDMKKQVKDFDIWIRINACHEQDQQTYAKIRTLMWVLKQKPEDYIKSKRD